MLYFLFSYLSFLLGFGVGSSYLWWLSKPKFDWQDLGKAGVYWDTANHMTLQDLCPTCRIPVRVARFKDGSLGHACSKCGGKVLIS
jgi:hypothetical protein